MSNFIGTLLHFRSIIFALLYRSCLRHPEALAVLAIIANGYTAAYGQSSSDQQLAILIAVANSRAGALPVVNRDIACIGETLVDYGGYKKGQVIKVADDQLDKPTRKNILATVPDCLKQVKANGTAILYFSGHGLRDSSGSLYLVPSDGDPAKVQDTCIPLAWFHKQLASCGAGLKFLVIDTCHAGAGSTADSQLLTESELDDLTTVVTLASCAAKQKSQVWTEKKQSLFSYWLVQGLKGHADTDINGRIDIAELYSYVNESVARTAKTRYKVEQTPILFMRGGQPGVPAVATLQPRHLDGVIQDMAEHLVSLLEEKGVHRLGVIEFASETPEGPVLNTGSLGQYCADRLERCLREIRKDAGVPKELVAGEVLVAAMKSQKFGINDLASNDSMQRLEKSGDVSVLAVGTLRERQGREVGIQCKLVKTTDSQPIGTTGGTAALNDNEWAMLGRSYVVPPEEDHGDQAAVAPPSPQALQASRKKAIEIATKVQFPLEKAPYRVSVWVGEKKRPISAHGQDLFVQLSKGENYVIRVESKLAQPVMMRLLVDGLNTLPEKEGEKLVAAKRVNLDEAREWYLDFSQQPYYEFDAFVKKTGEQGKSNLFLVGDASDSPATRQNFTEQIGIITAAFYVPVTDMRGIATLPGTEITADYQEKPGFSAGEQLEVVNIRYSTPPESRQARVAR